MPSLESDEKARWLVSVTSVFFILLQSVCTAVMAISALRFVIGVGALAAAAGLGRFSGSFHNDVIRIPMMTVAVLGSTINLYVIWRIRTLRNRPASQWRATPPTPSQVNSERLQIVLAILTLLLVMTEWITHRILHKV